MSTHAWGSKKAVNLVIAILIIFQATGLNGAAAAGNTEQNQTSENIIEEMNYGSGWSSLRLPAAESAPRLSEELAAQQPEKKERPRLKVWADPEIYIPGKPVRLEWQILGAPASMANVDVVVRSIPDLAPVDAALAKTLSAKGEIRMPGLERKGGMDWSIQRKTKIPLTLEIELWVNGAIADQQAIQLGEAKYSVARGQGGKIEALGGGVKLEVPAGEEGLVFDVRGPSPHRSPGVSLTGRPVEIIAASKDSGKNVKFFKKPLTLQIQYRDDEIFDWNEENLKIY